MKALSLVGNVQSDDILQISKEAKGQGERDDYIVDLGCEFECWPSGSTSELKSIH